MEANILIIEELVLACPHDQDVITTETKTILVKAGSVVDYAREYYNRAQEAILLLGQLAAREHNKCGRKKRK